MSSSTTSHLQETLRFLQQQQKDNHRGRTVLTVLYLCVLGLCFVVPVFYYFRMHCEERHARRVREMEIAGITEALEESQNLHREESRAARRKYREERRARILQLFAPVRMVLREENFPHLREMKEASKNTTDSMSIPTVAEETKSDTIAVEKSATVDIADSENDVEQGEPSSPAGPLSPLDATEKSLLDEDHLYIDVPFPGLQLAAPVGQNATRPVRLVPNVCSICLCNYEAGADIVWSSNEACDHVFHETCIEQWLMKQREGPLCPCCRRDFVIDPYDLEDDEEEVDPRSLFAIDLMESGEWDGEATPVRLELAAADAEARSEALASEEPDLAVAEIAVSDEPIQTMLEEPSLASSSSTIPEIRSENGEEESGTGLSNNADPAPLEESSEEDSRLYM